MIKKSLVSILIINYNNEKYLERAIKSCINQTYKNLEIFIYDDKSTDGSKFLLNKYSKHKKIKCFINKSEKKNIPAIDAKNSYYKLISKSKGEIIFLLDSDDYFLKDKVFKIVKKFNQNKKISLIQDLPLIIANNKKKIFKKNKNNFISFWPYLAPESCISFRKKFIKKYIKLNIALENRYLDVWLGFKLGIFSYYIDKSFYSFNKNLTIYKSYGESKKYPLFGSNWFIRRMNSYNYLKNISKGKFNFIYSFDYIITVIVFKILNLLKFNEKKNSI